MQVLEVILYVALIGAALFVGPTVALMIVVGFKKNVILAKKAGQQQAAQDVQQAMTAPVLGVGEITREKILAADPETARQLVGHMRVQHKALREYENLQRLCASTPHSKGSERPNPQATSSVKTSTSTGAGPDVPPWLLDDGESHSSS
ncbi:MAG: hypothetical protein ING75_02095 [Rhodocyclaceae bacterium]|nr:hypothetical protein [Rhodocyclaceae bacterium]